MIKKNNLTLYGSLVSIGLGKSKFVFGQIDKNVEKFIYNQLKKHVVL